MKTVYIYIYNIYICILSTYFIYIYIYKIILSTKKSNLLLLPLSGSPMCVAAVTVQQTQRNSAVPRCPGGPFTLGSRPPSSPGPLWLRTSFSHTSINHLKYPWNQSACCSRPAWRGPRKSSGWPLWIPVNKRPRPPSPRPPEWGRGVLTRSRGAVDIPPGAAWEGAARAARDDVRETMARSRVLRLPAASSRVWTGPEAQRRTAIKLGNTSSWKHNHEHNTEINRECLHVEFDYFSFVVVVVIVYSSLLSNTLI